MVFPVGAAIGAVGALGAGALSYFGQKNANKANIASAREAMDRSEYSSNTAYQRTMEDMRKAGLNPILAAKLGGASTTSGVSAQSQNEMGGAVSSAMEARRLKADIEKLKEDTELARVMQRSTENDILNKSASTASQVSLNNALQNQSDSQSILNLTNAKAVANSEARSGMLTPFYRTGGKISSWLADKVESSKSVDFTSGLRFPFPEKAWRSTKDFFASKSKHFK